MSLKNFRYSQFLKNYKKKSQFVTFVKISFSSKKNKNKKTPNAFANYLKN